jgi:carboxyl-terminal processing protease
VRSRLSLAFSFLLVVGLALSPLIHAQQNRSASKAPAGTSIPDRTAGAAARLRRNPEATRDIERDISEAITLIEDNYIDGKKIDYNAVFKSSITGMLRVLDPHSNYFDPKEFEEFRTDQRSEYFGIGATIGDLRRDGTVYTYIRATFDNSPADRAGLHYGDRIDEIDGQSMRGKTYPEVREKLLGPRGSTVKLKVTHTSNNSTDTVSIVRDAVSQPSIPESYMIRPGVGYVAMTGGFNLTTGDEFRRALEQLHSEGMTSLVLDLRGNHGGLVMQAVRVADTFLQRGQLILTQKGRVRGSSESYVAENEAPDNAPLVVLVNSGTASAAEIVAGALQDHDRALIVGETSFGKGLVQNPFLLDYGSALMLTIAKYYTPSGRLIQRDYSNGGFYDYYTHGGSLRGEKSDVGKPAGAESKTDTGRAVYGGGGISPDEAVKPGYISASEQRTIDPVFAFALDIAAGRVAGFENYKVQHPIQFDHDLNTNDFPVTDALFSAFKQFIASKSEFKLTPAQADKDRGFIERQLRYELATAAYGTVTAYQVFNAEDPQIKRAIDVMPRARDLALSARLARNPS